MNNATKKIEKYFMIKFDLRNEGIDSLELEIINLADKIKKGIYKWTNLLSLAKFPFIHKVITEPIIQKRQYISISDNCIIEDLKP